LVNFVLKAFKRFAQQNDNEIVVAAPCGHIIVTENLAI
jgi:hypothetical protein